jgi:hypothetical protein
VLRGGLGLVVSLGQLLIVVSGLGKNLIEPDCQLDFRVSIETKARSGKSCHIGFLMLAQL